MLTANNYFIDRAKPYLPYLYVFCAALTFLALSENFSPGPGVAPPSIGIILLWSCILPAVGLAGLWAVGCGLVVFLPALDVINPPEDKPVWHSIVWILVMGGAFAGAITALTLYL